MPGYCMGLMHLSRQMQACLVCCWNAVRCANRFVSLLSGLVRANLANRGNLTASAMLELVQGSEGEQPAFPAERLKEILHNGLPTAAIEAVKGLLLSLCK